MAKKRTKKNKEQKSAQAVMEQETTETSGTKDTEQQIKILIKRGEKKGFLTYEEMNDQLPEDAISPARLDKLLATLDEKGITLVDEADVDSQQLEKDEDEDFDDSMVDEESGEEHDLKDDEDELLERQLVGEEASRRIDDPIRMYLTQMGQIPLLTRKSEIALARKIEIARMTFRRKMLQSDYCARNAVELFQHVHNGTMSFDRTIKVGTEQLLTKNVIKKRIPENIQTVEKLLSINQGLFKEVMDDADQDAESTKDAIRKMRRIKRKIATLKTFFMAFLSLFKHSINLSVSSTLPAKSSHIFK